TSIAGHDLGQELLAHRRVNSIGGNQQRTRSGRTVRKDCRHAIPTLFDTCKCSVEAVAFPRQCVLQRLIETSPGGSKAAANWQFGRYIAAWLEPYPRLQRDPVRGIKRHADALHDSEQRLARTDTRAPPGQIVSRSLEHNHIPANAAQQVCCEEPGHRASPLKVLATLGGPYASESLLSNRRTVRPRRLPTSARRRPPRPFPRPGRPRRTRPPKRPPYGRWHCLAASP